MQVYYKFCFLYDIVSYLFILIFFQSLCEDDDIEIDYHLYTLETRIIDGDVSLPQNSFQSSEFVPHGKFFKNHYYLMYICLDLISNSWIRSYFIPTNFILFLIFFKSALMVKFK